MFLLNNVPCDAALPLPENDLEPYDVTVVAVGVPQVSAPLNRTTAMDVFCRRRFTVV